MDLLQCTAQLPEGSGQCTSCNALPHYLGTVGSGRPAIHCPTAWGQWAVDLLQYTAPLPWGQWAVDLLLYTPLMPEGSQQCNFCNTLPHCPVAVDMDLLLYTASLPGGSGQCISCYTLPHCLGAVGSGSPAIHCLTAWGQWAVDLGQYTPSLPRGSGQSTSCNTLPHCLGAVGSEPPAIQRPTGVVVVCFLGTLLYSCASCFSKSGIPNQQTSQDL